MVLMVLDHTRDFFFGSKPRATDLTQTNEILFFTRWITHFCAPAFILLAGISAVLYMKKYSLKQAQHFLLTRGLMLAFLEIVVIRLMWSPYDITYQFTMLQVIWILGWSMVFSSFMISLDSKYLFAIGGSIIALHGLITPAMGDSWGSFSWLFYVLFAKKMLEPIPGHQVLVSYSIIGWFAIMLIGIAIGKHYEPTKEFAKKLIFGGLTTSVLFVVLRYINIYGDPIAWAPQKNFSFTVISFLNLNKYPPSLFFILMTVGPVLITLGYLQKYFLGKTPNQFAKILILFGQVPLFFYVSHMLLLQYGSNFINWWNTNIVTNVRWPLYDTYIVWIVTLFALYYPCKWYLTKKKQHPKALSYF